MKSRINRTVVLLAISAVLFGASEILANKLNHTLLSFMFGAACGLAFAGTISFILMIVEYLKENKKPAKPTPGPAKRR